MHRECVSPTINTAEQALRKYVIFRKRSFETEAQTGSQNLPVLLSIMETCRRLSLKPLDHIRNAVQAAFNHKPPPSLLPET